MGALSLSGRSSLAAPLRLDIGFLPLNIEYGLEYLETRVYFKVPYSAAPILVL